MKFTITLKLKKTNPSINLTKKNILTIINDKIYGSSEFNLSQFENIKNEFLNTLTEKIGKMSFEDFKPIFKKYNQTQCEKFIEIMEKINPAIADEARNDSQPPTPPDPPKTTEIIIDLNKLGEVRERHLNNGKITKEINISNQ
jgi:hypothetical protein